jgi:hypothetical protein
MKKNIMFLIPITVLLFSCMNNEERIINEITNERDSSAYELEYKMKYPNSLTIITECFWDDTILYNGIKLPPQEKIKATHTTRFYGSPPFKEKYQKYKAKNWNIKTEFILNGDKK